MQPFLFFLDIFLESFVGLLTGSFKVVMQYCLSTSCIKLLEIRPTPDPLIVKQLYLIRVAVLNAETFSVAMFSERTYPLPGIGFCFNCNLLTINDEQRPVMGIRI